MKTKIRKWQYKKKRKKMIGTRQTTTNKKKNYHQKQKYGCAEEGITQKTTKRVEGNEGNKNERK